jgi:hypothetical protein
MCWIRNPRSGKNFLRIPDPDPGVNKAPDAQHCMSGYFLQERHVGELGESGVRFASTPLRPNLSTSRLHTSRSASRFRYGSRHYLQNLVMKVCTVRIRTDGDWIRIQEAQRGPKKETPMINFNALNNWILYLGGFSWCLKTRHVGLKLFFSI